MFGVSAEHLLILGVILLIFGPRRLPELGNTLGKAIKNFKDSVSGIEEATFRKVEDDPKVAQQRPAEKTKTQAQVDPPSHDPLSKSQTASALKPGASPVESRPTSSQPSPASHRPPEGPSV